MNTALSWDVQMPEEVARWITAHPPKIVPQPPTDVPRLTDEDIWNSNEIMAANAKCGLLLLDLAFLVRAVEAEVRRRCGVVE